MSIKRYLLILICLFLTACSKKEEVIIPKEVEEIPIFTIDTSLINKENDFYTYEDANFTSSIGVDISEYNGDIDFSILKEKGIEFVYIRAGWRGYYYNLLHEDKKYKEYYQQAKENDLKVGYYFFSQAVNEEEAREEAYYVKELIREYPPDLEVAYDFEIILEEDSRTKHFTLGQCQKNTMAFIDVIKDEYEPMIFAYGKTIPMYRKMDGSYKIWYSQYYDEPEYIDENLYIWQYSDSFMIEGIKEPLDINIKFIKKEA